MFLLDALEVNQHDLKILNPSFQSARVFLFSAHITAHFMARPRTSEGPKLEKQGGVGSVFIAFTP